MSNNGYQSAGPLGLDHQAPRAINPKGGGQCFRFLKRPIHLSYQEKGRALLTEIVFTRIARQGTACLISTRGQARTAPIEKFELDKGFQPYHPPSDPAILNPTAMPVPRLRNLCCKFELDEGFQPYHPPFRPTANTQ